MRRPTGKFSRDKGKRYERELAGKLRDLGFNDVHRTAQFRGNTGAAGDLEGIPGIHIEAKHQEKLMIYDWMEQSARDAEAAGKGEMPIVIFRRNNCEDLGLVRLEDLAKLIRSYISDHDVKLP